MKLFLDIHICNKFLENLKELSIIEQKDEKVNRRTIDDPLQSYATYSNAKIPALELARAGFHFSHNDQMLVCKQCGLQVAANGFTEYIDPYALHFVYSRGQCSNPLRLVKEPTTNIDNSPLGKFY